ncbi:hypothetical protein GCM10027169_20220 [Gordonia jinhuaensis]|uniref:Uncharacterized protein n=1 Tax=Gordonia jinhuaensis TaxID=1517702 RepID=A0A916TJ74_9ACTN|nr:hypothetical protein GCM10011489_34520 [Gordonia jinhuaensis]
MQKLGGSISRRPLDDVLSEVEANQDAADEAAKAARKTLREQRKAEKKEKREDRVANLKSKFAGSKS